MVALAVPLVGALSLVVHPTLPHLQAVQAPQRHAALAAQIRESRLAPIKEISPGQRYREMKESGTKFYSGRGKDTMKELREQMKHVKGRKVVVITGASSGLGLNCVKALLDAHRDGYFVVAAVRDPEKMHEAAEEAGLARTDYAATELQLASFQSVKDFSQDLVKTLPSGRLDRLVCNAAVYLPTDPKPRFTDDNYEMSLQVNHLGHFLLVQLLLPAIKKAKDARVCIVGSVTGNKNTVAGSLV